MEVVLVLLSLLTNARDILARFDGYVVGGELVAIEDYPFVASLLMTHHETDEEKSSWRCGSTILNQRLLLTAAHCLVMEQHQPPEVIASVGSSNKLEGTNHAVLKYIVHEGYTTEDVVNDIALALLKEPLIFGASTGRAILMEHPPKFAPAVVVGWGLIEASYLFILTACTLL